MAVRGQETTGRAGSTDEVKEHTHNWISFWDTLRGVVTKTDNLAVIFKLTLFIPLGS